MANLYKTKLVDLIPDSIRSDPGVQAAAEALDNELQAVSLAINETMLLSRLDELPDTVMDLLAWQWHVDFYEDTLPIEKKRNLVRQAIAWHKRKGTPGIVQEMVSAVFAGGYVTEWWEYDGQPYHFRVEATDVVQDGAAFERLARLINAAKNTRSWLDSIRIKRSISTNILIGSARHILIKHTISPATGIQPAAPGILFFGTVKHEFTKTTILPEVI